MMETKASDQVLRRLEKKGFVKSSMGGATSERGGRRKRFFTLNQAGRQALDEIMTVRSDLYSRIPKLMVISYHTLKASRINPVESLRAE